MNPLIKQCMVFVISLIIFVLLDVAWIGGLAKNLYQNNLGSLVRKVDGQMAPHVPAALLTWLVIVIGLFAFVVPQVAGSSILEQALWGALYGFVLYATYDLTNYAVLANWPLNVTIADICWGTFLNGLMAVIACYLNRLL